MKTVQVKLIPKLSPSTDEFANTVMGNSQLHFGSLYPSFSILVHAFLPTPWVSATVHRLARVAYVPALCGLCRIAELKLEHSRERREKERVGHTNTSRT